MKIRNNKALKEEEKEARLASESEKWIANLNKIPWLERPTIGDASETALVKFFQPIEDIIFTRQKKPYVKDGDGKNCMMPFNSTNKYAFVIVEDE